MRKHRPILCCALACFALPLHAQGNISAFNSKVKELWKMSSDFKTYLDDFNKDFVKDGGNVPSVALLHLRNTAIAAGLDMRATGDVIRIYVALPENDRATILPLVRDDLLRYAKIAEFYAQQVKPSIGNTGNTDADIEAVHFQDSLERYSATLTSVANTLDATKTHSTP